MQTQVTETQTQVTEKRWDRRFCVKDMSYRASVAVGKKSVGLNVLDFSANGIQIEMPLATFIPYEGTLRFREQSYRYILKRQNSDNKTKRLGLEISAIAFEDSVASRRASLFSWCRWSVSNQQGSWVRLVGNALFCGVAITGISFALLLLFGQTDSPYRSQLENLCRAANFLSNQNSSDIATGANSSNSGANSLKTQRIHASIDAVSRAQTFLNNENYLEAVKASDQAISSNRRNVDAWWLRGIALSKLAQYGEAIESLRQAISLNPSDPVIHEDLAKAYMDSRQFTAAIKQSQRGFELADGETKIRIKQLVARAYEARATNRLENDDADDAQLDRAEASRWLQ